MSEGKREKVKLNHENINVKQIEMKNKAIIGARKTKTKREAEEGEREERGGKREINNDQNAK